MPDTSKPTTNRETVPKIAMVASVGIGDGCIYLILANNLSRNGFDIVFYSNPISQLAEWLPEIAVKPYPKVEDIEHEFGGYDLVVADSSCVLGRHYHAVTEYPALAKKYVFISVGRVEQELRYDHSDIIRRKLPRDIAGKCRYLAKASGEIRFQSGDRSNSMVRNAVLFCENVLKLDNVVGSPGFKHPDPALIYRKWPRRVLIHPLSSDSKKNWPLAKFITFARQLRKNKWESVFTVSMSERKRLLPVIDGEFPVPEFPLLSDFAAYAYESAALIGNDSGSVHIASGLGLPTLTIARKGCMHRWRPGWGTGEIASPFIQIQFGKKRIWKPFLSVNKVASQFEKLIKQV